MSDPNKRLMSTENPVGDDPREPGPVEAPAPIGDPTEDPAPTGDPAVQDPTVPTEAPMIA